MSMKRPDMSKGTSEVDISQGSAGGGIESLHQRSEKSAVSHSEEIP
jgi:hypothetical protein